ncbi:MAG: hypothetical protein U0414_43700 [Polyangiaceae bacterium]
MQRHLAALVVSTALAWTPLALAQDAVTSDALFQRGVDDMAALHYDLACPAIAESLRLDPRPGTLFTLAECYAKAGKLASAVVRYDEYITLFSRMTPEQQSKQLGREKTAQEQRDLLKPDVPLLTVALEPGAPLDTLVKRDDTVLNAPSLGVALPVDPGEHTISAQPPNGPVTTQTLTIGKGERKELRLKVEVTTTTTVSTISKTGGSAAPPSAPRESRREAQRIAAFVLGGIGAAGLVSGAVAGAVTLARRSTAEETCDFDTHACTSQQGLDALSSARTSGVVSTVAFAVGGALVGTAAIVFFTAPSPSDAAPTKSASSPPEVSVSVSPYGGFAALSGVFQ